MDEPWELSAERRGEWVRVAARPAGPARSWPGASCSCGATSRPLHPDLLAGLPDGVTVCEWGYEANHPFDERTARLERRRRAVLGVPGHVELDVDRRGGSTT